MNKFLKVFVLSILPLLLIFLTLNYKASIGEYYLGAYYDPAYSYLINSLNLSQFSGYGVGHFDHPGTPVQAIGGVVINFFYGLQNSNTDKINDVLNNSEYYLLKIYLTILILNALALFILGYIVEKKTGNIKKALFIQLTPFFSSTIYYSITNVSPEPLLIFATIILIVIAFSFLNNNDKSKKKFYSFVLGFGIICGFGLATKLTFLPILIIPIILIKGFRNKLLFSLIVAVSFFIFILPAFSDTNAVKYSIWVKNLITHSGKYGGGAEEIVDSSKYFNNVITIFTKEWLFSITYFFVTLTLFLSYLPKIKIEIRSNKYFNLLCGIFFAMTAQVLIVSKHFEMHYLIPAFLLNILGLFVVYSIIEPKLSILSSKKNILIYLIVLIMSYFQMRIIIRENKYFSFRRDESHKIMNYLKDNYRDNMIVSTYGASNLEFSSYYGAIWGGTQKSNYISILQEKYPNYIYFDRWRKDFYYFSSVDNLKSKLLSNNVLIFQADNEEVLNSFLEKLKELTSINDINFKKVLTNFRGETIYEIYLNLNK
jgi:hypothetical protein